ncbi:UNVERIFIED_CONTAM: iron ABC transporter permease [Mumia flava]
MVGLVVCLVVLLVAVVASVAVGSRAVSLPDIVAGVFSPDPDDIAQVAVHQRLPRTLLGLLVGAALGLAGGVMQGLTRNPLADPGLLGVNAGASFFVVLALSFLGVGSLSSAVWFAFVGAAVTSAGVWAVGSLGRAGATPLKLALAGAATAAAFTSLTTLVLLSQREVLEVFRFWQVGSVGGASFSEILTVLPFLAVGAFLAVALAGGLTNLALGDDVATALGQRTGLTRVAGGVAVVLLCGTAVAVAGPIGFVGLTMPHLARLFTGPDYRWILPYAAALGAALLVLADVLGRVVADGEIEVGVMTALLGAPFFVAVVRRTRLREL